MLADNVPKNYKVKLEERLKELLSGVEMMKIELPLEVAFLLIKLALMKKL